MGREGRAGDRHPPHNHDCPPDQYFVLCTTPIPAPDRLTGHDCWPGLLPCVHLAQLLLTDNDQRMGRGHAKGLLEQFTTGLPAALAAAGADKKTFVLAQSESSRTTIF